MMTESEVLAAKFAAIPGTVIEQGVATGSNQVRVAPSTTSTPTLPAIIPVESGDRVLVATMNGTRVILGPIDGPAFLPLDGSGEMAGDLDMGGNKVVNVDDPTTDDDAANKSYVDGRTLTADWFTERTIAATDSVWYDVIAGSGWGGGVRFTVKCTAEYGPMGDYTALKTGAYDGATIETVAYRVGVYGDSLQTRWNYGLNRLQVRIIGSGWTLKIRAMSFG